MPESGYTNDVFISYPRRGETRAWVQDHFAPALCHCLALELDRPEDPKIYFDERLKAGGTWPIELGIELARSRVLVSLWTRNYLRSAWCAQELAHMLGREREMGRRTKQHPNGFVAIPIIHDGETIPSALREIQTFNIDAYFNPRMRKDGLKSEGLYDALGANARALADLIEDVPEWQPNWQDEAVDEFLRPFKEQMPPRKPARPRFTEP